MQRLQRYAGSSAALTRQRRAGWNDPVAGWQLHPLKMNTLMRRTQRLSPRSTTKTARASRIANPSASVVKMTQLSWLGGRVPVTKVAVYHEPADPACLPFRAAAGRNQAQGRTAGEALDALASQLPDDEVDTLVIVRSMSPDRFFSAEQRQRLEHLMALNREAQAANTSLSAEAQAELEQLIDAEVRATTARAAALLDQLGR